MNKLLTAFAATATILGCGPDTPYEKAHKMLEAEVDGARREGNDWVAEVKLGYIKPEKDDPTKIWIDGVLHEIHERANGVLDLVPIGGPNMENHNCKRIDGDPATEVDWGCDGTVTMRKF